MINHQWKITRAKPILALIWNHKAEETESLLAAAVAAV